MMLPEVFQKVVPDFHRSRIMRRDRKTAGTPIEFSYSRTAETPETLGCRWVEDSDDIVTLGGESFRCGTLHAHWGGR